MQDYAETQSANTGDQRNSMEGDEYLKGSAAAHHKSQRPEGAQYPGSTKQQHYPIGMMQQKASYGFPAKNVANPSMESYCRDSGGIYEAEASSSHFQPPKYNNPNAPTFSSPPNSPLVGLVFDPNSPNYSGLAATCSSDTRNVGQDRRSWPNSASEQILPIGTGARKKIMKSQPDRRCFYGEQHPHHDRYYTKTDAVENSGTRKNEANLTSESTSSLDFLVEGERMVSELCNISEIPSNRENLPNQGTKPYCFVLTKDRSKSSESVEMLLNCLDKIVIHDQIPNEIVQLAIEACTDAENIAIAHHNRPCFKNIHSICAKTRSNVQKSDSAVANLHSQGIPWVIKNFIFSFVRILDGWKGVKELLCEKHDTFSRIENKYYSPNIRECFVQWQAVTKEMLSHIYKTFKCLDQGFTMEQKSFTHNYYASNPVAPRHQNQSKYQPPKATTNPIRPTIVSSQTYGAPSGHWFQNTSSHLGSQHITEPSWPIRPAGGCKKYPMVPPTGSHNIYPPNDQSDADNYQHKSHFKYEPGYLRESKPRQSWTITSVQEFRTVENMGHVEQRELYTHLKQKVDAELSKGACPALMDVKSKMIPLSHVEKTLIPSMASGGDARTCYVQKNNSCGDTKDETEFLTNWGQILQKDPNQYVTQQPHNIQVPSNVVSFSTNIVGPVQLVDPDNDEFNDQSKVYMKPGSYKVPTKPSDPVLPFSQDTLNLYDNTPVDEISTANINMSLTAVSAVPPSKYTIESWPCLLSKRHDDVSFSDEQKDASRPHLDLKGAPDECTVLLKCGPSDRAWEAAKQSAPKLMDFIHDESKSDTARLYNALGLSTVTDDYYDHFKNYNSPLEKETRSTETDPNASGIWNKREGHNLIELLNSQKDRNISSNTKNCEHPKDSDKQFREENQDSKRSEIKEENKNKNECSSLKKTVERSKVAVSGVWYHPKKNKPIPPATSKKFERILKNLSKMSESNFIQNDMDMKSAPRFYEVVKYPMCLNDIGTKLRNASYTEADQVLSDFRRIFNNVRMYLKCAMSSAFSSGRHRHSPEDYRVVPSETVERTNDIAHYTTTYQDAAMKKNVCKVSSEFEKMFADEFPKRDTKEQTSQEFSSSSTPMAGEDKGS